MTLRFIANYCYRFRSGLLRDRALVRRKFGYGQPASQALNHHASLHQEQDRHLSLPFLQGDPVIRRRIDLPNQYLRVLAIASDSTSSSVAYYPILLLRGSIDSVKHYLRLAGTASITTNTAYILVLQGTFSSEILLVRSSFPIGAHHHPQLEVRRKRLDSQGDQTATCSQSYECGCVFVDGEKTFYRAKLPSSKTWYSPERVSGQSANFVAQSEEEKTQYHTHSHQQETGDEGEGKGEGLRPLLQPFLVQCGTQLRKPEL